MEFSVVVGNPPYNSGIDIDFVNTAYNIATKYVIMITPAKWQTASVVEQMQLKAQPQLKLKKNNIRYIDFRNKLVPHISKVVYYPDCLDIFGIQQADGISYYIIDKNNTYENNCTVVNKSNLQKYANSRQVRDITHQQSLWNIGNEIIEFIGNHKRFSISPIYNNKKYTVNINTQLHVSTGSSGVWDWDVQKIKPESVGKGGVLFCQDGGIVLTGNIGINKKDPSNTSIDIFTSDIESEAQNFIRWFNSKFTRFFILINISSLTGISDNGLRLVPAPPIKPDGTYNWGIQYTDEYLYHYYGLDKPEAQTSDGIRYKDIINSIIKERK